MADADRATCPQCGGSLPPDDSAGLCPRCLRSDTQGDETEIPPGGPSSPGWARRALMPGSVFAAISATLLARLWYGKRREQKQADDEAVLNRSIAPHDKRNPDEAIETYRQAIRLKPDHADAHYDLGYALHIQGKLEEAIAEYRTVVRLKPDDAKARCRLGTALHSQKKPDLAIAEYREAIRLKPDFTGAHYNLGVALGAEGKLDEAIAEYRMAIRFEPSHALAHNNLGQALGLQGKDEEIAEYRTAIQLKPDYAEAHYNLGVALDRQGKLVEAIAEYRMAIRFKPDYFQAHSNLGSALLDEGKVDEAITACREAIRLKPDLAEAHINLGNALGAQGKLEEAIAAYREAIRLTPDDADAHYDLGRTLFAQGKLDDATASFRKASDNAEPGSKLATLIVRALAESGTKNRHLRLERVDGVIVVSFRVTKILADKDGESIDMQLTSLVQDEGYKFLLLNFSDVEFFGPPDVIGKLLRLKKRIAAVGGKLKLCCINRGMLEVLMITGIDREFEIYPDEQKALDDF